MMIFFVCLVSERDGLWFFVSINGISAFIIIETYIIYFTLSTPNILIIAFNLMQNVPGSKRDWAATRAMHFPLDACWETRSSIELLCI